PIFQAYQPKNGIHNSSRLRMKAGSANSENSAKVSQADWCFEATSSEPGGIFAAPRISNLMPQVTRNSHRLTRVQKRTTARSAPRGISSVGKATIEWTNRFR